MGEYTRRMDLRIELDLWEWSGGSKKDTLIITNDVLNYRFQKTIKTPKGSCQLAMLPQSTSTHILDILNPMDVVKIYEFGTLKFIGYVQRISYSGSIARDGKPNRQATITAVQFGGLLVDAQTGFGLGTALGKKDEELQKYSSEFNLAISRAVSDGVTYSEIVTVLIDNFKDMLTNLGGKNFLTYLNAYLDVKTGLTSTSLPFLPRQFELYTGMERTLTFWQLAEQLVQRPFNEFWMDNGPRKVNINGEVIELQAKSSFVLREVPFDGTVGGVSNKAFSSIDPINIDRDHLLQFDLARSMDEIYTVYDIKHAAFKLDDTARILLGMWIVDKEKIGKYLFRPLMSELFYTRVENPDETSVEAQNKEIEDAGQNAANTLKAWFENNEDYLSGAITHMVPEDGNLDPRIGDKITAYGFDGYFYVEGIAHTWAYQGPLKSNLTVTRGYNKTKRIALKDRIFRRNVTR